MENKPVITIDLKKYLHDFLLHEFNSDSSGRIMLHRRSNIGLFIDSMYCISNIPVKNRYMENPVTIFLPISEENHYVLRYNFIYVPSWKEAQIIEYLEAEFRRRVHDFFSVGYEKKYRQKDIIEGFLKNYGMKNNSANFDQIKKLDFRNRENFKNQVVKEIQNAII